MLFSDFKRQAHPMSVHTLLLYECSYTRIQRECAWRGTCSVVKDYRYDSQRKVYRYKCRYFYFPGSRQNVRQVEPRAGYSYENNL